MFKLIEFSLINIFLLLNSVNSLLIIKFKKVFLSIIIINKKLIIIIIKNFIINSIDNENISFDAKEVI